MGFKMKSGNKISFKDMGSSPAKQRTVKNPTGDKLFIEGGNVTNDNMFIKQIRK